MHVTTNDAINAFSLLRDHVNENGFLYECYNLGIGALKTIQDGNYQLYPTRVSRETIKTMANYSCKELTCDNCKYCKRGKDDSYICMSLKAKHLLQYEQDIKEVEEWINKNSKN